MRIQPYLNALLYLLLLDPLELTQPRFSSRGPKVKVLKEFVYYQEELIQHLLRDAERMIIFIQPHMPRHVASNKEPKPQRLLQFRGNSLLVNCVHDFWAKSAVLVSSGLFFEHEIETPTEQQHRCRNAYIFALDGIIIVIGEAWVCSAQLLGSKESGRTYWIHNVPIKELLLWNDGNEWLATVLTRKNTNIVGINRPLFWVPMVPPNVPLYIKTTFYLAVGTQIRMVEGWHRDRHWTHPSEFQR